MKTKLTILSAVAALVMGSGAAMADGGEIDNYFANQRLQAALNAPAPSAETQASNRTSAGSVTTLFGQSHNLSTTIQPVPQAADGNGP